MATPLPHQPAASPGHPAAFCTRGDDLAGPEAPPIPQVPPGFAPATRPAPPRVALISHHGPDQLAFDWLERIGPCWPGGAAPVWSVGRLDDDGPPEQAERLLDGCDAAVVVPPRSRSGPALRRLAAHLEDRGIPGLLLVPRAEELAPRAAFCATALVPLPEDCSPQAIAAALYALLQREAAVISMRAELSIGRMVNDAAARHLERQHDETALAVAVQRAFLPEEPRAIPGLDVGVLFRPGGSLSGDVYDVVRLDEDHAGFFVADAKGHGVAAALLTMLISRLLPMKETRADGYRILAPGEALQRFNRAYLLRRPDDATLLTAIYGVINVRTGQVVLSSAGHPPAALVGPGQTATSCGAVQLIHDGGPAVGLFEDAEFPETRLTLGPGAALLLYTDGFEWAFSGLRDEQTGRRTPNDRYLDAFARLGAARAHAGDHAGPAHPAPTPACPPLAEAIEHLAAELNEQRGSLHQPDDVTLLALALDAPARPAAAPEHRAAPSHDPGGETRGLERAADGLGEALKPAA